MSALERTEFLHRLKARIEKGAYVYGDKSFDASLLETVEQVLEEVEDIAGWSYVLWVQLRRRMKKVIAASEKLSDG